MTILNRIASNWSRVEREKLNNNWTIIERYLSNLQGQINLLTGDVDVQALIDQINEILNQGNVVIADLESALQDATTVITNAENATTDANNATTEANDAAQSALNAVNDIQNIIDNFGVKGIYDSDTIYSKSNSVYHEGSSYIYTNDTPSKGNPPPNYPTVSNTHWQMTAAKGASGDGDVSKVNGKEPDGTGEVTLTPSDIGATSITEFNAHLNQALTQTITISRSIGVNGVQIVSGFTKKPKALIVNAAILDALSSSQSFVNDLNIVMSCFNDGKNQGSERAVMVGDSSTHHVTATVTINNDKTISLNWTTVGTPTAGVITVHIMALYHGGDE